MSDPPDRLTDLEEQVAILRARLTTLEKLVSSQIQERSASAAPLVRATVLPPDDEPRASRTGSIEGTLNYTGSIQFGEQPYRFRQTLTAQSIFEASPDLLAPIFAALSSPHRIIILRTLCEKSCTAQQLQEVLGMASAGQLYHHLKELQAVGLITQRERSAYMIEPTKVIPVCVALMIALSLATFFQGTGQSAPPSPDQGDDPGERI
jgi:ArsR family transcriptional regulator, arsenate/arsenite/antimonite-responsive transcriptional repressor